MNINFPKKKCLDKFKQIYSFHGKISDHKSWEIDIYYYDWYWVEIAVEWRTFGFSHVKPEICVGILGYYVNFKICDVTPWNKEMTNLETK